jgi:hypothetical protein
MPTNANFLTDLFAALERRGARLVDAPVVGRAQIPNPLPLIFTFGGAEFRVLMYTRRITPQRGEGTTHNRREGEWHQQMTFDDSRRGRGVRNYLARRPGYATVLLGYTRIEGALILAAWDASRRNPYGFSRSNQVLEPTLHAALRFGVGREASKSGEIVIAFRGENLPQYLATAGDLHPWVAEASPVLADRGTLGATLDRIVPEADAPWSPTGTEALWPMRHVPEDLALSANPLARAAAVLTRFDPLTLRPMAPSADYDHSEALAELLEHSTVVHDARGTEGWTMRAEARRGILDTMQDFTVLREALAANLDPQDPERAFLDAYLREAVPPVASQSLNELRHTLRYLTWFGRVAPGGAPVPEVRRRIARAELLAPFRALAGPHFRGRERELDFLREYAEVLSPVMTVHRIRSAIRQLFDIRKAPPLFIYGPGGTGKSTLVARFILEHIDAGAGFEFPFVYIDYDRPDTSFEDPATLLIDAAAQLAVQYPQGANCFEGARSRWQASLRRAEVRAPAPSAPESLFDLVPTRIDRGAWIAEFAKCLASVAPDDVPLLLVLDTFEEAQARGETYVRRVWEFLAEMQRAVPRLRAVLAGRAPLEASVDGARYPTRVLALGDFDSEAALGYLTHIGVGAEDARSIFSRVGGNPLSLQLAAGVVATQGISGLDGISQRRLLRRVDDAVIHGQLYRRILDHIHDSRVRRLAHPGLTLRRITPELIREVLAEPCAVVVGDVEDLDRLFEAFAAEVSLVRRESDGVLLHRSDVRRVMLPLLQRDLPVQVQEIRTRAVEYYMARGDLSDRVEELYHRLALGQSAALIDERWVPLAGPSLEGAIEEFPAKSQVYLANRLGREVSPTGPRAADKRSNDRA